MYKFLSYIVAPFLLTFNASIPAALAAPAELFVDAVVASVNGKPITLRDVTSRIPSKPTLSLSDASLNPEVHFVLNGLILERLIEEEAQARKVGVSDGEIDGYLREVSQRNSLSVDGFLQALKKEGVTEEVYRRQVRVDILRSKLTSSLLRGGVGISDEEIDRYLSEHPELSGIGTKLKLRQIVLSAESRTEEEATKLLQAIKNKFREGEDFSALASRHSEGSEAPEGGLLGIVAEEDLSSEIFDAVFSLEEGQISSMVTTAAGYHLFFVDERYRSNEDDDDDDAQQKQLREEVRKTLQREKMKGKMQSYFASELYKLHAVERKL